MYHSTMLDIHEEYEAEVWSVANTYRDLKRLSPRNKLLKLINVEGRIHLSANEEFRRKYPHDCKEMFSRIGAIKEYLKDLENATEEELRKRLDQNKPLEIGSRARIYL